MYNIEESFNPEIKGSITAWVEIIIIHKGRTRALTKDAAVEAI